MTEIYQQKIVPVMLDIPAEDLCQRRYGLNPETGRYSHPKGCPNYGKKPTCPPFAPLWNETCDMATWVIWKRFNLAEQRERMKILQPTWAEQPRRLECCLYWQKGARKPLKDFIKKWNMLGFFTTMVPEAMGINVTETMRQIGVILEWPPETWTYQVAMGGWLK